jgi:hypothetical protein
LELPTRRTFAPRSYGDFALQIASRLDIACPGFLNATFYMTGLKRQAIFANFAEADWKKPDQVASSLRAVAPAECLLHLDPLAQIACSLVASRAREIVLATYGKVPDGVLGAFARLGSEPLPRRMYRLLIGDFLDPALRHKGHALRRVDQIAAHLFQVIDTNNDAHSLAPDVLKLLAVERDEKEFGHDG